MLIKITDEFWIDFEDVRCIVPYHENLLKVFYKNGIEYTLIDSEIKPEFLKKCAIWHGEEF